MPLDKFVLILVVVLAAAALTVALGSLFLTSFAIPGPGWLIFVPVALIAYVAARVVIDRVNSKEDDYYDHIEK